MMKQVLFGLFAILAVVSASEVQPKKEFEPVVVVDSVDDGRTAETRNLNIGGVYPGDRLLYSNYFSKAPMANAIQSQDITYRSNSSATRITAIQVNEVGYTQWATARVTAGGLNRNTVTIRLSSARGYGYYFALRIYGR
ncbi:putative salivary secreted peptide [Anticarsia gemmatalis]|uniref:putative salivary secreted peptide n=1 Tax=Anticarsia gemmatalis TaxID=129554 RepID=UPI003F769C91